jgi:hypothetical protein
VKVVIDPRLGPAEIRVAGAIADVAGTILLKQPLPRRPAQRHQARRRRPQGPGRRSPRPEGRQFAANHKAWTQPFARQIMAWNARLARSSVRGQRIADVHGRAALLEWAGAVVDPKSAARGPAALARTPRAPAAPTLASYIAYIEALVAALA